MSLTKTYTGAAAGTIRLSDGSVWSWKGDHWLAAADGNWARATIPFGYIKEFTLLTAEDLRAIRAVEEMKL